MRLIEDGFVESIVGIWSALHHDTRLMIRDSEVHYLRVAALATDDDLASRLLLRKLRVARLVEPASAPRSLAVMNSFVEYAFAGGEERLGQLMRPGSDLPAYGLNVVSLLGAGLVGLQSGQTILWPDSAGTLCDLQLLHVENCRGLTGWPGPAARRELTDV